jgi:alpha-L-arabinofuranosidase
MGDEMIRRWHLFGSSGFIAVVLSLWMSMAAGSSAAFNPANLQLSTDRLSFYANQDGSTPTSDLVKIITISNTGDEAIDWSIPPSDDPADAFIIMGNRQGTIPPQGSSTIAVGVDVSEAVAGGQTGHFTIWDATAIEQFRTVDVFLRVCDGTCVSVDLPDVRHTVSPLIFGSQIDWLNSGTYVWDRPTSPTCTEFGLSGGAPRPGLINQLMPLGIKMLRYPSGTPTDFFRWYEALGPVAGRTPQIDPWKSSALSIVRECPTFGPDEFLQVAGALGTDVLTTSNAGTGSALEAAYWLLYNLQRGIPTTWWEFGNETYLQGTPENDRNGIPYSFAAAYTSPERYAAAFDEYARTMRSILPSAKIGAIASAYGPAADAFVSGWNAATFEKIQEPADFVSTHLLFPLVCTTFNSTEQVFRFLLSAPTLMRYQLDQLEATLARVGVDANKTANIAITEHGASFFCLDFDRNHMLASALFSALSFNVFMRDPRIVMAHHQTLTHPLFQAPLTTNLFGPDIQSAFYHVFRLYSQAAGGRLTASSVLGGPTFSSDGLGLFPTVTAPVLDSVAVLSADGQTLRLFVTNRSLTTDVTTHVALDGLSAPPGSISVATVNGPNYDSANTMFTPFAVITTARSVPALAEFDIDFPAHSLTVLSVPTGR